MFEKGLSIGAINAGIEDLPIGVAVDKTFNQYTILVNDKIDNLSSEQADAYSVSKANSEKDELYALVFKKNLPVRLEEMQLLTGAAIPNLVAPIELSVVDISSTGSKHICAIMKRPKGETLRSLAQQRWDFSYNFCLEKLLRILINVVSKLHTLGITHGRINPANIYMDEGGNITIGECISELCGVSQPALYETLDRAQCHPYGKSNNCYHADYYAIGVTVFALFTASFFDGADKHSILKMKFKEGTFNFLMQVQHVSGKLGDIIRGFVIDDKFLQWKADDAEIVLKGASYSISSLVDKSFYSRSIIFNDKDYFSKASLAYEMAYNWEQAKPLIKQDTIVKWLNTDYKEQAFSDEVDKIKESVIRRTGAQQIFSRDDEYLLKLIMILSPDGVVRYKGICFHIEAIGPMLAVSMALNQADIAQLIANILFSGILSYHKQIALLNKQFKLSISYSDLLERAAENIRKVGYSYGLERCLYDLNPNLPCQSHVLGNGLYYKLQDVINYLEEKKVNIDDLLSKKSIFCYIASKIYDQSGYDIKIENLKNYPNIEKSKELLTLKVLATAQRVAKANQLPFLGGAYAKKIKDLLKNELRGESIKKKLFDSIDSIAASGDLTSLYNASVNTRYLEQDFQGYTNALLKARQINISLTKLSNKKDMERSARGAGLKLAVSVSYIVSGISIIFSIIKNL